MWLFALGVLAVVIKLSGFTAVAGWSWWVVLSPFAAAALWWTLADALGITQRAAIRRHDEKVKRRRQEHLDALGMNAGRDSRSGRDSRHGRPSRH